MKDTANPGKRARGPTVWVPHSAAAGEPRAQRENSEDSGRTPRPAPRQAPPRLAWAGPSGLGAAAGELPLSRRTPAAGGSPGAQGARNPFGLGDSPQGSFYRLEERELNSMEAHGTAGGR